VEVADRVLRKRVMHGGVSPVDGFWKTGRAMFRDRQVQRDEL
jgi:hypothetical protein